jgi:hypothetical protein
MQARNGKNHEQTRLEGFFPRINVPRLKGGRRCSNPKEIQPSKESHDSFEVSGVLIFGNAIRK